MHAARIHACAAVPEGAWSVSTHRRAWLVRAAVVMIAAAAGAVGFALPAAAAPPDVSITNLNAQMNSGATTPLSYTIKNNGSSDISPHITISFDGDLNGLVTCTGGDPAACGGIATVSANSTKTFNATLTAGSV